MTDKIAVPLSGMPSIVLLNNGERMRRRTALEAGYRVVDAASLAKFDAQESKTNPLALWRSQVSCLPEAQGRSSAVAQLIESQPLMSIERVRSFLRGLPTENQQKAEIMPTKHQDERAARRAAIAESARAFNNSRGYSNTPNQAASLSTVEPAKLRRLAEIRLAALQMRGEQVESKKLRYALDVHSQTGSPLANVFAQLKVDTSKLIP